MARCTLGRKDYVFALNNIFCIGILMPSLVTCRMMELRIKFIVRGRDK